MSEFWPRLRNKTILHQFRNKHVRYKDFPLKDLKDEDAMAGVIRNVPTKLWAEEYAYLVKKHMPPVVVPALLNIYKECVEERS